MIFFTITFIQTYIMSGIILVPTADILKSWKILSGAFEHPAPMLDEMYPKRDTPEGDERIAARLNRKLNKGIGMVSVDAMIDGQLAGVAVWQFMDELPPTDIKEWEMDWAATWPEDDERQYLQEMWTGFIRPRYDAVVDAKKEGKQVLRECYLCTGLKWMNTKERQYWSILESTLISVGEA